MPRTKRIAYLMFFNKRIPRKCGNIWKLTTGILRYKYRVIKKVEFQTDKDKTVRKKPLGCYKLRARPALILGLKMFKVFSHKQSISSTISCRKTTSYRRAQNIIHKQLNFITHIPFYNDKDIYLKFNFP